MEAQLSASQHFSFVVAQPYKRVLRKRDAFMKAESALNAGTYAVASVLTRVIDNKQCNKEQLLQLTSTFMLEEVAHHGEAIIDVYIKMTIDSNWLSCTVNT